MILSHDAMGSRDGGVNRVRGESGATLILALIFLVVVSMVVIGLVQWTGNNLANTSKFVSAQTEQSVANSANQFAVQFVHYNFLQNGLYSSSPQPCWTTTGDSSTTLDNLTVDSWCMTRWYPSNPTSIRVVTISTCLSAVTSTNCGLHPLLQTIVSITDDTAECYPVAAVASSTTCGNSLSIVGWQFGASPPVVATVATGGFSCAQGLPVVITGTNLNLATNVDFLDTSQSNPQLAPATSFSYPGPGTNTIDACTPASLSSPPLYLMVSTPFGTNEYDANSQWTG